MRVRLTLLTVLAFISIAVPKEPVASGPTVGQKPGPYSFLVATGTQRGQPTCFVCETAEKPGVIVFARSVSAPLAQLMTACDEAIAARPKDTIRGWMTVLGEKAIGLEELGKWSKQQGLTTMPVGVFDDAVGPPSYKLGPEADVTVLLFINRKVTANYTFRADELKPADITVIAAEAAKLGVKQ